MDMHLVPPTYEAVMKEGLNVTRNLPPGGRRDIGSGAVGALNIPLAKLFPGRS